jgi:hypothetical protein
MTIAKKKIKNQINMRSSTTQVKESSTCNDKTLQGQVQNDGGRS